MLKRALSIAAIALSLMLLPRLLRADDTSAASSAKSGTVTGRVVDQDGKAVANAEIAVVPRANKKANKKSPASSSDSATTTQPANEDALGNAVHKGGKGNKKLGLEGPGKGVIADAVATGSTDDNGNFTIANVPEGTYGVIASVPKVGRGHAKKVFVVAGSSARANITLEPRAAHGKKAPAAPSTQPES